MRTTVSIEDRVLRSAKRRARQLGLTLGQLVERALRRELERPAKPTGRPEIPVFRGGDGVCRGVDVSSMRTILEALDRGRPLEKLR
jgi:hypothetical protein